MGRRRSTIDSDPALGRERTAALLKKLRTAGNQARMLKARVREMERRDVAADTARRIVDGPLGRTPRSPRQRD